MRNTLVGTDRFAAFIMSSQVYANARDFARFGLLYAQGSTWDGERLLYESSIEIVRTRAPASGASIAGNWREKSSRPLAIETPTSCQIPAEGG